MIASMVFPFLDWVGELRDRRVWQADLIAGISVFTVLVPQSLAHAQLANLSPHHGLYTAFLPPIVAALLGSSRHLSTGSVAVISLMSAAAIQPLATPGTDTHIAYTILLAMIVGIVQIGLGLARLGSLVNLVSHPVILGFTNAVAIIIGTSLIGLLFGVAVPTGGSHFARVNQMIEESLAAPHLPTMYISALALGSMILARWLLPASPWVLIAVVVTTVVTAIGDFSVCYDIRVVGAIPKGIPVIGLPQINVEVIGRLVPSAVTIALVGFVGAISISKTIATRTRQRIKTNRELLGQGMANILGSLTQSYTVSGSFVRSAVNYRAGGRTGFSSVIAGLLVLVTLIWLTPLFYHLPLATLAAIITVAVGSLIQIEPIIRAWRAEPQDAVVAAVTFVTTLSFAPRLDLGIFVGVGLSLVLYLYRTMNPRIAMLSKHPDGSLRDARAHGLETCDHVCVLRIDGSLYFASAGYLEDKVLERVSSSSKLRYLVVDGEGINHVDATGVQMLLSVVEALEDTDVDILFVRMKKQILDALERTAVLEAIGRHRIYSSPDRALHFIWDALNGDEGTTCNRDCPVECPLNRPRPVAYLANYRV